MSLQPEAVAYHTDRTGSSYFFGAGSAPAPAPASALRATVYTAVPGGVIEYSTIPIGSYTVFAASYASGPGSTFLFQYTGTPPNGAYWVFQSNCIYSVIIKQLVGGLQPTIGTIKALTSGGVTGQTGILTYQNGSWSFY